MFKDVYSSLLTGKKKIKIKNENWENPFKQNGDCWTNGDIQYNKNLCLH